jgi:hypothetical protein
MAGILDMVRGHAALSITYVEWISMLFPLWVLMLSVQILVENYRRGGPA